MRSHLLVLSLACSLVTANSAEASPDGSVSTSPTINALLYDLIGVPPSTLNEAMRQVSFVYSRAGVGIRWESCYPPRGGQPAPDACQRDPNTDEVVVRITRPSKSSQWNVRASALGVAIVLDGITGRYVSVFYGRIRSLADAQRVKPELVLGFAICHEIGHLLLRSTGHSSMGLMRYGWNNETRQQAEQGHLRFLMTEAQQIRQEAAKRAVSAVQQHPTEN